MKPHSFKIYMLYDFHDVTNSEDIYHIDTSSPKSWTN